VGYSSGSAGRLASAPAPVVPLPKPTSAGELIDAEITTTRGEANRVAKLIDAIKSAQPGDLVVSALNAGQGDCCVMRLPDGRIVVVDCNVNAANVNVVGFLQKAGIKMIDLLIVTHPDRDHVSGLPAIADAFKVGRVLDGRFRKEDDTGERTSGYEEYRAAIEKLKHNGAEFTNRTPIMGDKVELGGVKIDFLAPRAPMQAGDANEASLCFRVSAGSRTILFGGDVTQENWCSILEKEGSRLKSDIFWSSHHGAASGCFPEAVKAIAPRLTIVSVGENTYGHPHDEALECYRTHSKDVRRTDNGSIGIVSRGGASWDTIV
jgi:competence protein ComEC